MDGPLTPAEVEEQISAVLDHLEQVTEDYAVAAETAGDAEAEYRIRYWTAFLTAKADGIEQEDGTRAKATEKMAEGHAVVTVADHLRAYKIAAAKADAIKQALITHRTRLDALRTVAANARTAAAG